MIAALAEPLPLIVIAELLGLPATDREREQGWSGNRKCLQRKFPDAGSDFVRVVRPWHSRELLDYLAIHVEQRRRDPREDLLTALVHAEENQSRLSEDENLQHDPSPAHRRQ